jgi:hypothetical protein
MAERDLLRRVEKLEETVDSLRDLPERTTRLEVRVGNVELQIVHLRDEMHSGFSAVRTELKEEIAAVRTELREDIAELSRDLSAKFLDLGTQIQVQIEGLHSVIATTREGNPPTN